ncbi:ABC transporter ATP-binding protein [Tranquillimonas alkanivorans]|uniref:Cu-processing system ATP-binding protein n=1 Tax=Tranquillimonas alkanivorans TaxID=441119 RepID=A0A1I5W598_9RHOB|nr:ABC transporter ATP-binding protein [Tranquillimonas alkanivorans]SFQ14900.1 Cu-processing system ATP-binding protein [Tranquillimonas alkanivorans]
MSSLKLSTVTKTFGRHTALDRVGLTVGAGERVALLGHNGAGKSTLMKIVLGLIPADGGSVEVLGAAPGSGAARAQVAYLPENAAFHPSLTGEEQMALYLRLRGAPASQARPLLDRVGLGDAARRRIGTYSKGMRQRVGLAQALIGRPRLLVLDEPTSGLDPVSRREFYAILEELAADGAAILLSSHALTEVEARTDRIVILSKGRVVADDTLAGLRRNAGLPTRIHVAARPGAADDVARELRAGRRNGVMVDLVCPPDEKLSRLGRVAELGHLVEDVEVVPPSLEDIYDHYSRRTQA